MNSTNRKYDYATPIELNVWKDPQGYAIVEHVRDEVWCYFRCWESPGVDADYVGCLHFSGVWHLHSSRHQALRGYPHVEESDLVSYYLTVENSSLLKTLFQQRSQHSTDWKQYDRRSYHHWIVESHDYYTDIVASEVSFSRLSGEKAQRCFEIWSDI